MLDYYNITEHSLVCNKLHIFCYFISSRYKCVPEHSSANLLYKMIIIPYSPS